MAKNKISEILESIEPQKRLKQLIDHSNLIEVDPNVPPNRYYRSGLEMVRMANVYYDEGNLESAYCLYLKFMTLFLEKIRGHPDFAKVPPDMKTANQKKIKEVLPKAEKLKQKLLEVYKKDYDLYMGKIKQLQIEEDKRRKTALKVKDEQKSLPVKPQDFVTAEIPGSIDNVSYPDSTLTSPTVTPIPSAPLLPSESNHSFPPVPTYDRSKKPSSSSLTENYDTNGLRTVLVPSKVMTLFQNLAQSNTKKNIETCGILAGKLERNQLIITHMIVPKQNGTPDSCTTTNEEEIFDYQDQYNLITIGWIHTHPTQTAFLSSVDLHTQCPYQLLMPEAIAIVCSPKFNNTGFFHLTPNYGLQYIAGCRKSGFHPHPTDPPLFKTADHIKITELPLDVLDLRK